MHTLHRRALRGARALFLVSSVGTALLGAAATPVPGMLVLAPCLGVLAAAVTALIGTDDLRQPSSRRTVVYAGTAGVLLVPFANGVELLGGVGGAVLLGLLVVGPLLIAGLAMPPGSGDVATMRELLAVLPTEQLLEEWRASEELCGSPADRAMTVELRAHLIEELSRRDPEGVSGWLATGDSSPESHIRADRGRAG